MLPPPQTNENDGATATATTSSSSPPSLPFCPSNLDHEFVDPEQTLRSGLDRSAVSFLDELDLPAVHPICVGNGTFLSLSSLGVDNGMPSSPLPTGARTTDTSLQPPVSFGLGNMLGTIVTLYCQVAPALLAISELWLRLFAFVLAPLSTACLLVDEVLHWFDASKETNATKVRLDKWRHRMATASTIIGMASSAVLLTDSLYVHEYGRSLGLAFFVVLTILSTRTYLRRKMGWMVGLLLISIKCIAAICIIRSEGGSSLMDHPGLDVPPPTVKAGTYYNANNPFISSIIENWPETYRVYTPETGATPYFLTGDVKTGIPFLINSSPEVAYRRVWAHNPEDGEYVALDVAFPDDNAHHVDRPVYMILHGLNGGSSEEYVREFVWRRTQENSTCIVMVARGLMDTPVMQWNVFHGARISDVHSASGYIRKALGKDQLLAGVGYSMGAIVLSNYVARSGKDCHLDAAMAISGGLDMREQINFYRSQRLWQPMLAKELRDTFIVGKFDARYRHRLTEADYMELMRSSSISSIDTFGVVTYNGFDDLMHYYSEMSAFGDHSICVERGGSNTKEEQGRDTCPARDEELDQAGQIGRLSNIAIPLAVVHALDDPLITWRAVAHVDPRRMINSGDGNLILLLTKGGGHVGWPLGNNPASKGWEWMNNCARDFVNAVDEARR